MMTSAEDEAKTLPRTVVGRRVTQLPGNPQRAFINLR